MNLYNKNKVKNAMYEMNINGNDNVDEFRKTSLVELIGFTRVRIKNEDIWIPPLIYNNEDARPYSIGCFPTQSHVKDAITRSKKDGLNFYVEHMTQMPRFGYAISIDVINGYTRDNSLYKSIKFSGKVYDDDKVKLLNEYKVTSLYDLRWSLQYIIFWKEKEMDGQIYKAIDYINLKEVSCTKSERFKDCYTLIANNKGRKYSIREIKLKSNTFNSINYYKEKYKCEDECDPFYLFKI